MCHNGRMAEDLEDETRQHEKKEHTARLPAAFSPARLEAFSDGVLAVIITIMVLGIHPEKGGDISVLVALIPALLIYLLSFTFIGIYWNNHHHLLRVTSHIDGSVMWANLHLLFWLSLIPIATLWSGENPTDIAPAVAYGAVGLLAAIAYNILERFIIRANQGTDIERALGDSAKDIISPIIYIVGMGLAFVPDFGPILSYLAYAVVAIIWFIPDRRLTRG
jgi:TMEM175 potassium channel family protein